MGRKLKEFFEFDLGVKEDNQEESVDTEFKKEEILQLISDYAKKDPSIKKDLDKLIERPEKSDEDIAFDFKAIALKNKKILKDSIIELIDKDKSIQSIIDELATPPKKEEEPKKSAPADETRIAPLPPLPFAPKLPAVFNAEDYAEEVIKTLREYPEARAIVLNADTTPSPAEAYFDEWNDSKHKKEMNRDMATRIASNDDRFRTLEKAIEKGRIYVEERIADRNGKPTDRIFPKEFLKNSGK